MRTLKHNFSILYSGPMSFVIRRTPSAFTGTEKTRKECEEWAIVHAVEWADEAWPRESDVACQ